MGVCRRTNAFATFLALLIAVLFGAACTYREAPGDRGAVELIATTASALTTVDRLSVTFTPLSGDPAVSHDLVLVDGQWRGTVGHLAVGDWSVSGTGYVAGVATYAGPAVPVTISAGTTAVVSLVLHDTPAPFADTAPRIDALVISTGDVAPGGDVDLTVDWTNPGTADPLGFTWSAAAGTLDVPVSGTAAGGTTSTHWTAPATGGDVALSFALADAHGVTAGVDVTIHVVATSGSADVSATVNNWPVVTSVNASPSRVLPGDATTVTLDAADPDGDGMSYAWDSACGTFVSASPGVHSDSQTFTVAGGFAGGTCDIHVTVTDTQGGQTEGTLTVFTSPGASAAFPPDAPAITGLTAENAQVTVSFTPPVNDGGSAILDYTVTSSPGDFMGIATASPVVVGGLTNGTPYTFTVTARNAVGSSLPSSASSSVTPCSNTDTDPYNCGGCGVVCATASGEVTSCAGGVCGESACKICGTSQYVVDACTAYTDTVCGSCDGSCATCTGPSSNDCASCRPDATLVP